MKTTRQEYENSLWQIQSKNPPTVAILIPKDEPIYEIDLNQRTIEAPEFLSVETDHRSETIFFKVDRFFDNYDLANTVCVIQYINAGKGEFLYAVPFYDITTFAKENKIIFPWCIEGNATKFAGPIQYAVRFYKLAGTYEDSYFIYNLNTLPTTSKILHGMNVTMKDENGDDIITPSEYEKLWDAIKTIQDRNDLYWEII